MKLGISTGNFSWPVPPSQLGAEVCHVARAADAAGFDSFWAMDHFFQIAATGEPPEAPILEAYQVLAFLAGQTERIRLGTLVTCAVYRDPGVLMKTVTSLDVLSEGRAILGLGAGWYAEEAAGLGLFFPPLAERFERLEETLQIAHQMWAGDETAFEGRHYHLGRLLNSPGPLQRPRPPILIGGGGEKKTLRLVARYGDMCNLADIPSVTSDADLVHKLEVLAEHCAAVGRDESEIEKTVMHFAELGDDPVAGRARVVERAQQLAALGFSHMILVRGGPWDRDALEAVLPLAGEIAAI